MNLARKQLITIYITLLFLLSMINLANFIKADPPCPSLFFSKSPEWANETKWYGTFQGSVKSEKVRISLYDNHLTLMETGLISEYSENISKGYYIEYHDCNLNNKLDAIDIMIIHEKSEVQPSWGVVLTYEPTGEKIAGRTLSGGKFPYELKNDNEQIHPTLILLIGLYICICIIIIAFDRKKGT